MYTWFPMIGSKPITAPSPTFSANVYEQLRGLIVRGRLLPGARLTEIDVARELRVSRTPAREALRRLRQEGLLVATGAEDGGKVRLAVAPMTAFEARELYRAAGAIEGVIARNVEVTPPEAREELARKLRLVEDAFEQEAIQPAPDWDALFDRHGAFHRTMIDALAGARLRNVALALKPHLDRYEYFYAPLLGPDFAVTFDEHTAIIRALASGTADEAEQAVRQNWFLGAERLVAGIARVGEAGFLRMHGRMSLP
jgi:GntR family transcriptional regulator, rspAB operon transcriptional repressor